MVVEGSHTDTGRITRGWKQNRENARAFSWLAKHTISAGCQIKMGDSDVLSSSSAAEE